MGILDQLKKSLEALTEWAEKQDEMRLQKMREDAQKKRAPKPKKQKPSKPEKPKKEKKKSSVRPRWNLKIKFKGGEEKPRPEPEKPKEKEKPAPKEKPARKPKPEPKPKPAPKPKPKAKPAAKKKIIIKKPLQPRKAKPAKKAAAPRKKKAAAPAPAPAPKKEEAPKAALPVSEGEYVGKVTHFFPNAGAAAFVVEGADLAAGDRIEILGESTNFSQKVLSLQINRNPVQSVRKGDEAGIETKKKVCPDDRIYKIK